MPIPPHLPPDLLACIEVWKDDTGKLHAACNFHNQDAKVIEASEGNPDIGYPEPETVLHDAAHLLVCLLAGIGVSPVLERVAGNRPGALDDPNCGLDQERVDLEEAAVFAVQNYVKYIRENGVYPESCPVPHPGATQ